MVFSNLLLGRTFGILCTQSGPDVGVGKFLIVTFVKESQQSRFWQVWGCL